MYVTGVDSCGIAAAAARRNWWQANDLVVRLSYVELMHNTAAVDRRRTWGGVITAARCSRSQAARPGTYRASNPSGNIAHIRVTSLHRQLTHGPAGRSLAPQHDTNCPQPVRSHSIFVGLAGRRRGLCWQAAHEDVVAVMVKKLRKQAQCQDRHCEFYFAPSVNPIVLQWYFLTLMLQLGGLPPDALFILLLWKRLELWQRLLWLFLNICGLKMLKKISDISTSISNMAAGKWTPN